MCALLDNSSFNGDSPRDAQGAQLPSVAAITRPPEAAGARPRDDRPDTVADGGGGVGGHGTDTCAARQDGLVDGLGVFPELLDDAVCFLSY